MAFDAFLMVRDAQARQAPGLPVGESQDPLYKGAIELNSFTFGVENAILIGAATGAGAGKATFKEFTVTKPVDSTSGTFFKFSTTGQHFLNVTLAMRKAGSGKPYLIYSFGTVVVTNIEWSGSSGDDTPTETLTFAYGQLQVSYIQQRTDGSRSPAQVENWDRVANRKPAALSVPDELDK